MHDWVAARRKIACIITMSLVPTESRRPVRAAARCIGSGHTVAGATHMWPEERPREMVEVVKRFLTEGT